jgi:hypothetical protein
MFDTIDLDTDPITALRGAVETLATEDGDGWSSAGLSERLVGLLETRERLDAVITRLAGRWDPSWLAYRSPLPRHKARRLIGNGRLTVDHEVVDDALTARDITTEHVEAITNVAGNHRKDLVADSIEVLVDSAAGLGVDDYGKVTRRWAALADDQVTNREFTKQHERRGLYLAATLDGTVLVDGRLAPDAGASVITALDRLAPPDPADAPDGPRSLPQRRADALVDLCHQNLTGNDRNGDTDGGDTVPAAPVTMNVIVDVATLLAEEAELDRLRCDVERVGPVGRSTLERLGCGAGFSRVVMDGPSVVLDLGRSRRLASAAQRRALLIRDRGCVFDGCGRPGRWCDIHHLVSWLRGGLTDLDGMVLLCRRHHVLCHETGWTIERDPDGSTTTLAPGHTPPNRAPP